MVKKARSLKDFDDKTLEIIEKAVLPKIPKEENVDINALKGYECPNTPCGGTLKKVKPLIKMGELELFECPICESRKYLQVDE